MSDYKIWILFGETTVGETNNICLKTKDVNV